MGDCTSGGGDKEPIKAAARLACSWGRNEKKSLENVRQLLFV
jgi:hypothetical protein